MHGVKTHGFAQGWERSTAPTLHERGLLDDDEIARLAAKAEEPYHAPDGIHRPRRRFDAVLDGLSERERTAKDE